MDEEDTFLKLKQIPFTELIDRLIDLEVKSGQFWKTDFNRFLDIMNECGWSYNLLYDLKFDTDFPINERNRQTLLRIFRRQS